MNANELAEIIEHLENARYIGASKAATMLRQQQAEIDRLNYDLDGFKQNFFVSGFHLQIKMANEQLLKQQEQIDALKSELDRAVELYTDKAIENEALKANRKHDFGLGEASGFIKGHKENPYKAITNTKIEPTVVSYTHPVKEQDAIRYRWLRAEFEAGRETYLAEGMPSGERLDEYIDEQLRKAQEK